MLSEFYGRTRGINTHMTELSIILSNNIKSMNVKPDIVHMHHAFTPLTFKALKMAKKRGIPVIVTNHSIAPLYDIYFWKLLKLGFKYLNYASAIIAASNAAKRFISNFTSKDIVVILNGVDVEKFRPMKSKKQSPAVHRQTFHKKGYEAANSFAFQTPERARC